MLWIDLAIDSCLLVDKKFARVYSTVNNPLSFGVAIHVDSSCISYR